MKRAIIGIIEDDPVQGALLEAILNRGGLTPLIFHSVQEFRRRNAASSVDLALLDWNMPGESGLSFLKSLRNGEASALPIIFTTGNDEDSQVVEGLQAGADDYLVKPVKPAELIARIHAVLRRGCRATLEMEVHPPYEFHLPRRRLRFNGEQITTTPKEFDLMLFMFQRAGRIISREAILAHVWRTRTPVPTRTVDTYISRLRQKFGLDGRNGWTLKGFYRQGYCLMQGAGAEN